MSGKKGVEINMLANDKDFQRGVKNVEEGLEQVADALDDVSRDADKTGRKLGDEISDGAKDAERSVEKLERSFKEVADASKRETAKAGDAMKHNTKEATTQAARDLEELKDEAMQNASETFSSFDGSFDSLVDGIQGTLGGIVSNIGPVGAIAGAAAAVGLGLLTAELQRSAERAAEIREETSELAKEIIDAGGSIDQVAIADKVRDWSLEIADNKEWWELWQDSAITNLERVRDIADKTGYDLQGVFDAMSGQDTSKSLDLLEEMETRLEEVDKAYTSLAAGRAGGTARAQELKTEKEALEQGTAAIRERLQIQEGSIEDARALLDLTEEHARQEEALAAATEARTEAMNSLQGELDEAVNSWGDYYDAETGATDPAAYIAAMQARMDATSNFNTNVQSLADQFGLTADEVQSILDQGVDFAPMLQSILDSGMGEQYAEQIRSMVDGGQAILDGSPTTATVTTTADTSDAEAQIDAATEPREAEVTAEADTAAAEKALTTFATTKRTVPITAAVDTAAAETALTNWINRQRTLTVTVSNVDREGRPLP